MTQTDKPSVEEQQKIDDMNEAIANFAGLKSFQDSRYGKLWPNPASDGVSNKTAFSLEYHKSWDWLMPAWEKVYDWYLSKVNTEIALHFYSEEFISEMQSAMIRSNIAEAHKILYDAIVFIKNQNK